MSVLFNFKFLNVLVLLEPSETGADSEELRLSTAYYESRAVTEVLQEVTVM